MTESARPQVAQVRLYGCISALMWIAAGLLLAPVAIGTVILLIPGPDVLGLELGSLIVFGIALASSLAVVALVLWILARSELVVSPAFAAPVGGLVSVVLAAAAFPFVAAPIGFSIALIAVVGAAGAISRYGPLRTRTSAYLALFAAVVLGVLVAFFAIVVGS